MSTLENRGQDLLRKWLSGEINYAEELELFELAANDDMLKGALEGYISQDEIYPIEKERLIQWQSGKRIARKKRSLFSFRRMSLIAAVLIVALMSSVVFVLLNNEGQEAESLIVDVDLEKPIIVNKIEPIIVETEVDKVATVNESIVAITQLNDKEINKEAKKDVIVIAEVAAVVSEVEIDEHDMIVTEKVMEVPLVTDLEATNKDENTIAQIVKKEPAIASMTENEVSHFDEQADKDLKSKVYSEAKKELEKETSITALDFDIKDGVDPDHLGHEVVDSTILVDAARAVEIGSPADAAGKKKQLKTNNVSGNIIIKEYQIEKRDILNPPMEDFNTLVRAKYKRKGKPAGGYLKYKQYLRESSSILFDTYRNTDHLEEVLIKFRVFNDGNIEFIELFGIDNAKCIEAISAAIASGPKWELQDYYESIDVEVPFKVLHPFIF